MYEYLLGCSGVCNIVTLRMAHMYSRTTKHQQEYNPSAEARTDRTMNIEIESGCALCLHT